MGPDDALRQPATSLPPLEQDFNRSLALQFLQAADLLETQHANRYRVRAYRRAADALRQLDEPASAIYRRTGLSGLIALPAIGRSFALAIADMTEVGRWRWMDRLKGEVEPELLLATVAGIGPRLAERLHSELGIESLEELETAANDGRLRALDGFGSKRVQSIKDSLAGRLAGRGARWRADLGTTAPPPVEDLLSIDVEYRTRAERNDLPTIAPRRFNPEHRRWLPVLHTVRGGEHYTAVFSNTARANELGRTDDWVVIYADGPNHGRWTVVTETSGPRQDQRAVRGVSREPDP